MGIFAADMRRAIISPRFVLSALLVACLRLFSDGNMRLMEDVVQTYVYGNELSELVFLICGIPFINGFVEDWNGRVFLTYVARCGIKKYALSKFITAILSAALCGLLGSALYVAVMACKGPIMLAGGSNHDTLSYYFFGGTLERGMPIVFLFGRWLSFTFVQIIIMAIALCFTCYCQKQLITLISPFVIYYLMAFLVWKLGAPGSLLPARQINGNMTGNDLRDLLIYIGECCLFVTLFGGIYIRRMKELMRRA